MKNWTHAALESLFSAHKDNDDHFNSPEAFTKRYKKRYSINSALLLDELQTALVPLSADDETIAFLNNNPRTGDLILYSYASYQLGYLDSWKFWALGFLWSRTDVLGYLQIGHMHVLSTSQAKILLEPHLKSNNDLLDLGAGAGYVTDYLAPLFERVVTTELSLSMATSLRAKGYECD